MVATCMDDLYGWGLVVDSVVVNCVDQGGIDLVVTRLDLVAVTWTVGS